MAITEVRLIDISGAITQAGERTYTHIYQVQTDSTNDSVVTVRTAAGIPARLTTWSQGSDTDQSAELLEKKVKLLKKQADYKHWLVTCEYMTPGAASLSGIDPDPVDDPLLRPTVWSGSFVQFSRTYNKDNTGKQIKNVAGDPFVDPGVVGDDSRLSIEATKNYSALNVSTWADFADAVNNATWWGLAARKIKVQSITWQQQFHQGVPYYAVQFSFHINKNTWDVEVLEAGYYEQESGTGNRTRIKDKYGNPVTSPWPLDADGSALTQTEVDNDEEEYGAFKIYTEKDFSLLGLPATLGAP